MRLFDGSGLRKIRDATVHALDSRLGIFQLIHLSPEVVCIVSIFVKNPRLDAFALLDLAIRSLRFRSPIDAR